MSDVSINSVLSQMRSIKIQAQNENQAGAGIGAVNQSESSAGTHFTEALKDALDTVNESQKASGDMKTAFEHGDPKVSLTDVMIASQKSRIMFQATLQVRNHVVKAYQDIMNMPV